jgi:hypothetical protein
MAVYCDIIRPRELIQSILESWLHAFSNDRSISSSTEEEFESGPLMHNVIFSLLKMSVYDLCVIQSYQFIIIFLHGLGRLTCSGIDELPLFPGASTISSSSKFVVEGVFQKSGVVQSFKMVDPVLFVFGCHVLYSRDL